MVYIAVGCPFSMLDNARIAKDNAMAGHIAVHISVWRYQDIIPYSYLTYNCCIYTYPYAVTYRRYALSAATVFLTYGHSFVDITIFTNHSISIDSNATNVSQI